MPMLHFMHRPAASVWEKRNTGRQRKTRAPAETEPTLVMMYRPGAEAGDHTIALFTPSLLSPVLRLERDA